MRIRTSWARLLFAWACAPLIAVVTVGGHALFYPNPPAELQETKAEKKPAISEGESKAAQKINSAPDPAGKLKAAEEFLKKYPKSTLRPQVAGYVAGNIGQVTDAAQQTALAEQFLSVFKEAGEADPIYPVLVNAYVKSNRVDDAFRAAASALEKNRDDIQLLTQITIIGAQQVQQQNPKYVQQSQQYGARAVSLMEADKKPAAFDDARWKEYKARWLPDLYMSTGLLSLATGNTTDAQDQLHKAVSLNPSNPFAYALLGNIVNNEYQQMAQQYNAMPAGPSKDDLLKKSRAKLEQAVDLYAHSVALSEGNAQYQQLHDQLLQDLQSYYKYLHNGSTDGLQAMIDRYKKPATSQ